MDVGQEQGGLTHTHSLTAITTRWGGVICIRSKRYIKFGTVIRARPLPTATLREENMIDAYQTSGTSPTAPFEPLIDEKQAGELLGLHPKTIQRLARLGSLPAIRIGRYWRFRASALNRWIELSCSGQPACVGEPAKGIQ
jgi:excisionase family DNA binding protein